MAVTMRTGSTPDADPLDGHPRGAIGSRSVVTPKRPEYLGDVRSASRPRRWVDASAAALILGQAVAYVWLAVPGSFYADDLRESSRAAADPWSLDWIIGFGTYRHFAPLERGWFSFLVTAAPLNLTVAIAAAAAAQILVTLLLWLLLRRLAGPSWYAVLGLATYAVLPMAVPVFLWHVQAVSTLPVMAGGLAAAHGALGWRRSRRWGWILIAALGLTVAALTWEKWLALPFLLALFVVTAISPSLRPGAIVRALIATWPLWALCLMLLVPYTLVWIAGDFDTDAPLPPVTPALQAWAISLSDLVFPNLMGGPWAWAETDPTDFYPQANTPSWAIALLAALLAVILTVASRRVPAAVARFLLITSGATTVVIIPPILGRLAQFGFAIPLAPRYLVDVMPWVAVGVTVLGARWAAATPVRTARQRAFIALLVITALAGSVLTTARFVDRWWQNPAGKYIEGFRASQSRLAGPAAILDTEVPPDVMSRAFFTPYNAASEVLLPLTRGTGVAFGAGDAAWIVDPSGAVVPATFEVSSTVSEGPCRPVQGPNQLTLLPLGAERLHSTDLTARLVLRTDRPVGFRVGSVTADGVMSADSPTRPQRRLEPGTTTLHVLLPPFSLTGLWLEADAADSGLCVERADLGTPVATEAGTS